MGLGPANHEVEVSVFGPGFGECSVIHVGDGHWIIVDSCLNKASKRPAALEYLESIGADLALVKLIVATHWHDDHVRGLAALVEACPHADVCISAFLTNEEFLTTVFAHDERPLTAVTSGVREMRRVLDLRRGRRVIRAVADRRILQIPELSHGKECEVWALSPCDGAHERFLQSLSKLVPGAGSQKRRVAAIAPNSCSVVVLLTVGSLAILLGADLEEEGVVKGWSAILSSAGRPNRKAAFFKVPHHGSSNAHHPDVWRHMLVEDPVYAVAPYDRGHKLPTNEDLARLLKGGAQGYLTAPLKKSNVKRTGTVGRVLSDMGINVYPICASTGQVRARSNDVSDGSFGAVDLFNGALSIDSIE